jgi:CO/xanthine dehydrogenase Mo-binding subunit
MTTTISKLSRRQFLATAAAAGGGLALGIDAGGIRTALGQIAIGGTSPGNELGVWVFIKPNDDVVIRVARSEMGQGSLTGLAQLVAEELECGWSNVTTDFITAGQNLSRKRVWGEMGTGGSRGIRTSEDYVRRGGAAARMMLLQAAADLEAMRARDVRQRPAVRVHLPPVPRPSAPRLSPVFDARHNARAQDNPSRLEPCCPRSRHRQSAYAGIPAAAIPNPIVLFTGNRQNIANESAPNPRPNPSAARGASRP